MCVCVFMHLLVFIVIHSFRVVFIYTSAFFGIFVSHDLKFAFHLVHFHVCVCVCRVGFYSYQVCFFHSVVMVCLEFFQMGVSVMLSGCC